MKIKGLVITAVLAVIVIVVLSNCFYVVAENEFALISRFSEVKKTDDTAGLKVKVPFIDAVSYFPRATMLYDIPESEVLTADKKNMTVDSYLIWEIQDPLTFYKTLGSLSDAELRLNALTYNALKTLMGTLEQNKIINQEDASERNDIYEGITSDVNKIAKTYGINVLDVKIKRLDLPADNEQAVYSRMISDRKQIADKYTADGEYEASIIRNDVDKQVNIIISDAEANAARIEAEGEAEYMRMLAAAYDSDDKKDFYEFNLALEALQSSLANSANKTVIIDGNSKLGQLLIAP